MIQELKDRTRFQSKALARSYPRFKELIDELRERILRLSILHIESEKVSFVTLYEGHILLQIIVSLGFSARRIRWYCRLLRFLCPSC